VGREGCGIIKMLDAGDEKASGDKIAWDYTCHGPDCYIRKGGGGGRRLNTAEGGQNGKLPVCPPSAQRVRPPYDPLLLGLD
jgi:hypothetical protein